MLQADGYQSSYQSTANYAAHLLFFQYFHGMEAFRGFVLGQHDSSERAGTQSPDAIKVVEGGRVLKYTRRVAVTINRTVTHPAVHQTTDKNHKT